MAECLKSLFWHSAELQSIAGTKTKTNRRQLHKRTAGSTNIQQFRLNINHLFGVGGN